MLDTVPAIIHDPSKTATVLSNDPLAVTEEKDNPFVLEQDRRSFNVSRFDLPAPWLEMRDTRPIEDIDSPEPSALGSTATSGTDESGGS